MSKAFTKDENAADAPLVLRQRAPLPEGVPNYVTASGLAALHREHEELLQERNAERESASDDAQRVTPPALAARIIELEARIASAVLVDVGQQPREEVRFGATVTVAVSAADHSAPGERSYQIVGVDEANAALGRIAFTSPLARALLGKRIGEPALLSTPRGDEELEVVAIRYDWCS